MNYTTLPGTTTKVSKLCLGTMTFGEQNNEQEAHQQMNYALEKGINFFDTAELYPVPATAKTYGDSERFIGRWLKETNHRKNLILASKIAGIGNYTSHIRKTGFSPNAIKEAIEGSLKRLQTDYIDLYQLHWPIRDTNRFGIRDFQKLDNPIQVDNFFEILYTLNTFIKEGKVLHIGLSNESPWGAMKFVEESKLSQLPFIRTVQNPYSLLNRLYEQGLSEISLRENVGLLAYSPLGFGVLTGKYINSSPKNARITLFPNLSRYSSATSYKATLKYYALSKKHNLTLAQLALAFVTNRPFVTSNIIGATTLEQLKENIDSLSVTLSDDLLKEIDIIHDKSPNPAP